MPYQESPYFETPPRTAPLWKYMYIDKFMAMLNSGSLYFPNVHLFKDKYEGSLSEISQKEVEKTCLLNENTPIKQDDAFFVEKRNMNSTLEKAYLPKAALYFVHSFQFLLKDFSNHLMFCNCWFLKNNESHAMWAEYGDKAHPTSIAIQTTVGDLLDSLEFTEQNIHIGRIKYKNYKNEHIDGYEKFLFEDLTNPEKILQLFYAPIMHKRDIYDDEHEVRAVISFESVCEKYLDRVYTSEIPFYSDQMFRKRDYFRKRYETNVMEGVPKGLEIKINLKTLIKAVVMSPNVNLYFFEPLEELMINKNLDPHLVRRSDI